MLMNRSKNNSVGEPLRQFQQSMEVSKETGKHFVKTELELGLTFCHLAAGTPDAEKRARNIEHAKRAYDGAFEALTKLNLDEETRRAMDGLRTDLKQALASLGEHV
jgi:hypothetical protein